MLNVVENENLPSFLKGCIEVLRKKHPRFSSNQLAAKLGIPNSTFDRISKEEVKNTSFDYALTIVRAACGEDNVNDFVQEYYPEMLQRMEKVYNGNFDVKFVNQSAEKYFDNALTYEIIMLLTSLENVPREDIAIQYGAKGLEVLDELLQLGVITCRNDVVSCSSEHIKFKQSTTRNLLVNLIQNSYDIEAFGKKDNWLSVQYNAVNLEKVLPELKDIMTEAGQKIRVSLNKKENAGKDVVWAGLTMDSLVKQKISSTREVLQ